MADLEAQQATLRQTLSRISGARQVPEELLTQEAAILSKATGVGDARSLKEVVAGNP